MKNDFKGFWCLVLHSHLPFVKHPEYPDFLEEDWFYEAMNETYIPLLRIFERLVEDGVYFRVTISLTPPLLAMMEDELLNKRFKTRLEKLIEFAEKEVIRTRYTQFYETAKMYERIFKENLEFYNKYNGRIITAYKRLQDAGFIEIITCGATHGFLPLKIHKQAVYAQIKIATIDYEKKFGRKPRGIWLAECAYTYGVDEILKKCGLRFFFVEAHGILYGEPRPRYGVYAPIYTKEGVAVFGRDMETAHQVWSADYGYPGDPDYREFYRDAGYDLDYDYVRPYLHSDGVRRNIGVKYYRITGKVPLNKKEPYNPQWAINKAYIHAGNFLFNREQQIMHLSGIFDRHPIVVSPYDCELFGHWWFEGPWFLNFLFRKIHELRWKKIFTTITPIEYLELYPKNQI
ncbi:MAG: DUF1957 domain-containing protein, partial [bacterium]|nr:DUF1957 domain-containing protein [bacterium]